jgi:hypothetical protein
MFVTSVFLWRNDTWRGTAPVKPEHVNCSAIYRLRRNILTRWLPPARTSLIMKVVPAAFVGVAWRIQALQSQFVIAERYLFTFCTLRNP